MDGARKKLFMQTGKNVHRPKNEVPEGGEGIGGAEGVEVFNGKGIASMETGSSNRKRRGEHPDSTQWGWHWTERRGP